MIDESCEQRFRILLERSREQIALADAEGRLLEEWSLAANRRLGYEANELRGQCLFDYVHPDDLPALREVQQNVLAAPSASAPFAARLWHKSGGWRWVEGCLTNHTHDERIGGVVINYSDVTERKRAEESAATSEALLARVFEAAPIGIVMATMDRVIRRVNGELCRALGYHPEELLGRDVYELIHPEDREPTRNLVAPARAGEVPVLRHEARFLSKGGRVVWMNAAAFYVRGEDGRPMYAVGMVQDVTGNKKRIAELKASRARVHQLAGYVVEARQQERASIAREIHDELGQMLTALIMELDLLTHEHLIECPRKADMEQRLQRVRQHVRDSMKWTQRMAVEQRPDVLEHLGLIGAIVLQGQRFEAYTGVLCRLAMPAGELELPLEQATTVFRIFQEALNNVARHSRAKQVNVRLRADGETVALTVKDDGVGLPQNISASPQALGLLGMKERAQLHGGQLRLSSRTGRGTTVTLRLPLRASSDPANAAGV